MRVLVTGATSMIGDFLLPMLVDEGHEVFATSRRVHAPQLGVRWLVGDLALTDWSEGVGRIDALVNLASLALLVEALPRVIQTLEPGRLIAFGSTSMLTKRYARGKHDRQLAESLKDGEAELDWICTSHGVNWNILRPTLIYSLGRDKNLTMISSFIRRFRFFPLIGSGGALRQPVAAEDLAIACVQLLTDQKTNNKAYNLSGADVLSYKDMVIKLFEKEHLSPRFIHVSVFLLQAVIAMLRILPRYRYLTPDMAQRMSMDMVFSHYEASRDFGYAPRPFSP